MHAYDEINADFATLTLLSLPAWKWSSIVEAWLFRNTEEDSHAALQRELDSGVDFTWISSGKMSDARVEDPARWQSNSEGESLLSVHRKK